MRSLTDNERQILERAALEELPGRELYIAQIAVALVAYDPSYADIGIAIPRELHKLPIQGRFLPVNVDEIDKGGNLIGQVSIMLNEGYLSGIEYTDFRDDRAVLPNVETLVFSLADPNDRTVHELRF